MAKRVSISEIRKAVRKELLSNGKNRYGLSDDMIEELTAEENPIVEEIAYTVFHRMIKEGQPMGILKSEIKKLLDCPILDDGMQTIRNAVREDIILNGSSCYGLSDATIVRMTTKIHPAVEEITQAAYCQMDQRGQSMDDALEDAINNFFTTKNPE